MVHTSQVPEMCHNWQGFHKVACFLQAIALLPLHPAEKKILGRGWSAPPTNHAPNPPPLSYFVKSVS